MSKLARGYTRRASECDLSRNHLTAAVLVALVARLMNSMTIDAAVVHRKGKALNLGCNVKETFGS